MDRRRGFVALPVVACLVMALPAAVAGRRGSPDAPTAPWAITSLAPPSGLFWPYTARVLSFGTPLAIAIADVNGDGRNDVLVTNDGDSLPALNVYLQTPSGSLSVNPVRYSAISNPLSLDVGDLDGDGRMDVVIGSSPFPSQWVDGRSRLSIRRQNASGTLDTVKTYVSVNARWVKLADLDADGRMDVVGLDPSYDSVDVFRQNGDGSWAAPVTHGGLDLHGAPRDIEVGDVNGDGRPDIVTAGGLSLRDHVPILFQQPDRTFAAPIYHPVGHRFFRVAVGDVNGDHLDDVVLDHLSSEVGSRFLGVLAQNASGLLDPPSSLPSYDGASALELGDVNGDGRRDVVMAHSSRLGVYLQSPDGTFAAETLEPMPVGAAVDGLAIGDINSDGQVDIALIDDTSRMLVILRHRLPHELALSLVASSYTVTVGATATYTATVSNNGFLPVTGAIVTYTIPKGMSFVSAEPASACALLGETVTCPLGALNPGAQEHVSVALALPNRRGAAGTYVVTADVTANEDEFDPSNNVATATTPAVVPCATLADGGFELGRQSASWLVLRSSQSGPLCDPWECVSTPTAGPRSGAGWAWFGGEVAAADDIIVQTVLLRPGSAVLKFFLWNGQQSDSGTGELRVLMDGETVVDVQEGEPPYTSGYAEVTADLSAFADGGEHELRLQSVSGFPGVTSFSVDDVRIVTPPARPRGRRGSCP